MDGFSLGEQVDAEADGAPSIPADGDDMNGSDDEDGVTFLSGSNLTPGTTVADVQVTLTNAAGVPNPILNAWIDFNGNEVFDPNEQIATNLPLVPGASILPPFDVPETALVSGEPSYARFRLSAGLEGPGPTGPAEIGEVEDYQVFFVAPARLTVAFDPSSISENGGSATGTVTRTGSLASAVVVNLTNSDPSEAGIPSTVTIAAGNASATFGITGVDDAVVDGSQNVTVTATTIGYLDGTASLQVTDDDVAALILTVDRGTISEAAGAAAATATVTRNSETSSALSVSVSIDDTTEIAVPGTVTIPVGQASAQFPISAVDDLLIDGTQTVTITAAAAGHINGTTTLDVTSDDVALLTFTITPSTMSENGGSATGRLERNGDLTNSLSVNLSNSDLSEAAAPLTVTIPTSQSSADFTITAIDDAINDGNQIVTLTAAAGGFPSVSASITVTDDDAAALLLTIDKAAISEADGTSAATATVTRNTDPSSALSVTVLSSDTSEATAPASVTIPAAQASFQFPIDAVDDALVDGIQTVILTASATAHASGSAMIDVRDNDVPLEVPSPPGDGVLVRGEPLQLGPQLIPATYLPDDATLLWFIDARPLDGPFPQLTDEQIEELADGTSSLYVVINETTTLKLKLKFIEGLFVDYGDLPDFTQGTDKGTIGATSVVVPDYRTKFSDGGPRHVVKDGMELITWGGSFVEEAPDAEIDAATHLMAEGDNQANRQDEATPSLFLKEQKVKALPAGGTGGNFSHQLDAELELGFWARNPFEQNAYVNGWCDLNFDGEFTEAEEMMVSVDGSGNGVVPKESELPPPGTDTDGDGISGFFGRFTIKVQIPLIAGDDCKFTEEAYFPIRIRYATNPFLGPDDHQFTAIVYPGEVEDHFLPFTFLVDTPCGDDDSDSLVIDDIPWTAGSPLQLNPELVPLAYRDDATEGEWFLNRKNLGVMPLLDPEQAAAVANGTGTLAVNIRQSRTVQFTGGNGTIAVEIDHNHRVAPKL
ncbi:MAG: hypothetical protein KDN22_33325, partial [Verrucomicrobiae bacterium]|nr:hypothetical protein [Verrucomicrobiae bacterium]